MNYRERMKEYLKEPDEYYSQYGKWAILNREQKDLIKRLLREMDGADEVIKHQYFEIERLKELSKVDSQQAQEIIIELKQTIERLNKKIEQYENPEDMTLMFMWCDEKAKDEIKRLNNIINELEEYICAIEYDERNYNETWQIAVRIHNKLQELKGSDKDE